MTTLTLFFYICVALLVEVVAGAGVFIWRRRAAGMVPSADTQIHAPSRGAWPDWRDFRVTRTLTTLRPDSCIAAARNSRMPCCAPKRVKGAHGHGAGILVVRS